MHTDVNAIARFVTRVTGIDGDPKPLEVEIVIRRTTESAAIAEEEESPAPISLAPIPMPGRKNSLYVHAFTTNLSDANKQGMDSMVYWGTGPRKSKTYIVNQALTEYLHQYEESRKPLPPDKEQGKEAH